LKIRIFVSTECTSVGLQSEAPGTYRPASNFISTQTQNIKLCNVGKYNQSKDEKADKQH